MSMAASTPSMRLKLDRRDIRGFLRTSLRSGWAKQVPFGRLVRGTWHGFTAEHILLFELDEGGWDDYLCDLDRYRVTHRTNFMVWPILHDKLVFDAFMARHLPLHRALFWVHRGRHHVLGQGWTMSRFADALAHGEGFVLKRAQGGLGNGIVFLEGDPVKPRVNGASMSMTQLRALLGRLDYHVCYPWLRIHPAVAALFPGAANLLRLSVFVGLDGEPRLLAPALCIGTSRSAPVEHFAHGGISCQVDEERGILLRCIRRGADGTREYLDRHPDTNAPLVGFAVPFWHELREMMLSFHRENPAFDCVGWDIAITEDGPLVVEGNHNPSLRVALMHRNLSEEPAFREFLVARGVLDPRRSWRARRRGGTPAPRRDE
jgi:hypothetical protein